MSGFILTHKEFSDNYNLEKTIINEGLTDWLPILGIGALGIAAVAGIMWWSYKASQKTQAEIAAIIAKHLTPMEIGKIAMILGTDIKYQHLKNEYARLVQREQDSLEILDTGKRLGQSIAPDSNFSTMVTIGTALGSNSIKSNTKQKLNDLNAQMQERAKEILPEDLHIKLTTAQYELRRKGHHVTIIDDED